MTICCVLCLYFSTNQFYLGELVVIYRYKGGQNDRRKCVMQSKIHGRSMRIGLRCIRKSVEMR